MLINEQIELVEEDVLAHGFNLRAVFGNIPNQAFDVIGEVIEPDEADLESVLPWILPQISVHDTGSKPQSNKTYRAQVNRSPRPFDKI